MAIRRCPYCKAIIDESQKYCNNCGTQLLFPEDESNEEPIKGEKILDEDFEDKPSRGDGFVDDVGLEREEIDLEAVLKGAGHFPDEFTPPRPVAPGRGTRPTAPPPPEPVPPAPVPGSAAAVSKRAPRPRKKPEPVAAKSDTREEIARLIAALEEKEKKAPVPAPPKTDFPLPESEPEPESRTPLEADFSRPEPEPSEEAPVLPINEPLPNPVSDSTSWEAMLRKPATADLEDGPLPGAFDRGDEAEAADPPAEEASIANPTAGDTMDFEEELMRHTPQPLAPPTRMGIPERVAGESARLPLFGEETPPRRERSRKSIFEEELPPAFPAAALAETEEEEEEEDRPPRRLGFFRKIGALLFDVVFIAAVCLGSLWLAARLMDASLFELLTAAQVAAGLYFLALLFGYFFLFLFFLGETLGDKLASPRS